MYGEYDLGRYHASAQDEDSENFHSYPSYHKGKPKRTSRLGKGGSRLNFTGVKTVNLSENDGVQELTNDDSSSITGPESASPMSWLRETPVKNDTSVNSSSNPQVAFRTVNTIHRSMGIAAEKSINDHNGSIPFAEMKVEKLTNPLFVPECKRSLSFKSNEPKPSVLQDLINFDNVRKTPGLKVASNNFDKVIVSSTKEKENFISRVFSPKFNGLFEAEPKVYDHLYMRKSNEIDGNVIDLSSKEHIDTVDDDSKNYYKLPDASKEEHRPSHNFNQELKCSNEPLCFSTSEHVERNQISTSKSYLSSINNGINNVFSNSYSNFFKESHAKGSQLSNAPFSSHTENFKPKNNEGFMDHLQTKHPFGYPFVQSENNQSKPYNDPIGYNRHCAAGDNFLQPPNIKTPGFSTSVDDGVIKTYPQTVVHDKSKIETYSSIPIDKKCAEVVCENKPEKFVPIINKGSTNIRNDKEVVDLVEKPKNSSQIAIPIKSEQLQVPSSYASAVSNKLHVKTTPDSQKNHNMAPAETDLMKPPQGFIKSSKSTLIKTQSSSFPAARFNDVCNSNSKKAPANEKILVNNRAYDILSTLGKGGSSEVFLVLEPHSSKLMAVKCVNLSQVDKIIAEGYLNEVELLQKLQKCDSVIRMFDHEYVEDQKFLYVVMEKGETDLSKLLRDILKTKNISMSMIMYYWTEMLYAVKDIHDKGIIHSDLKPANFLLVCGRLKLIDFGIASSLQGDMTSVHKEVTTGTWNYMSPEAIKNNGGTAHGYKISYKSDVWSLGCILYNLIYGKTPFSHITNTWGKLMAIVDPSHAIKFPEEMEGRGKVPQIILKTLKNCLTRDPKQRPSVKELLNYDYYQPSAIGQSKLDSAINKVRDEVASQIKNILPSEYWAKIAMVFSHDYTECVVDFIKIQMAEKMKAILPAEHWSKISHVFVDVKSQISELQLKNSVRRQDS